MLHKVSTEQLRFDVIEDEIINKSEKLLVMTGSIHAFTKYKNTVFDYLADNFIRFEDRHLGNLLYKKYPNKVCSILLHQMLNVNDLSSFKDTAPSCVETIINKLGNKHIGFDLENTPMGEIRDLSKYFVGYTDFILKDLVEGYIFLKPHKELTGCTIDYSYLDNHTLEEVLDNFPDPEWHKPPTTTKEYWSLIEDGVNIKKRYKL